MAPPPGQEKQLAELLAGLGVQDVATVLAALGRLGIAAPADLDALDAELWSELDAELKAAGASIGDRAKLRAAGRERLGGSGAAGAAPPGAPAAGSAAAALDLPTDLFELRKAVAAMGLPDEGMRGSVADAMKLRAAADPASLAVLCAALRGRVSEATAAAATIRSISISRQAATSACASGVVRPLCESLRRPAPLRTWALMALLRLAQYKETHPHLMGAGAAHAVEGLVRVPAQGGMQLHLVAALTLSLLSETGGPHVALQVPLRAIPELVSVLRTRLFAEDAQEVVERSFCGIPAYSGRHFVVQALARVIEQSAAHAAVAWQTNLPELVCGILEGIIANDSDDNRPYGSSDAMQEAVACAKALLASKGGEDFSRAALQDALRQSKL